MKKYLYLILMVAFGVLIASNAILYKNKKRLQSELSSATTNVIGYQSLLDSINNKCVQLEMTVGQINNSNDSLINKLNEAKRELKIKDKNLESMQYISETTTKVDSIILRDSIFIKDFQLDTTIGDKWCKVGLNLKYPNSIIVEPSFNNELMVFSSYKKQFINTPNKIFFIRWFQKKQKVIETEVIDNNPYSEIKESRFINIIGNE